MSVYYDPTEQRETTRMPDNVLRAGKPLKGLEALTGADMLISTVAPALGNEIADSVPGRILLRKHTNNGLLVQRKTATDALNSIPHYANILAKMLDWTDRIMPWLLLVGDYKPTRRGTVQVDNFVSEWSYAAFIGALEKWQLRGGGITTLSSDALVGPWVAGWHNNIDDVTSDKLILPRKPSQTIITGTEQGEQPWRVTLATLPGIGPELATNIARYCGSLSMSLCFLSDPAHMRFRGTTDFPKGVGATIFPKVRDWLGLDSSSNDLEILVTAHNSDIVGTGVPDSAMAERALKESKKRK